MIESIEYEGECPGCGSTVTEIIVEPLFTVGAEEAQAVVLQGAFCRVCKLHFITPDVKEFWDETEVDESQYKIDRKI